MKLTALTACGRHIYCRAGICDRHAVEFVASNARSCVQWLIDQGVLFDTHVQPNGEESYHLTREGGHSHRRILHAADATGREVQSTLVSKAQNHPNIPCWSAATQLI
ncbi:FAD-binding protein [Escherichia coli]